VSQLGGWGLLQYYSTLASALKAVYPDFNWAEPTAFAKQKALGPTYWRDLSHQREFFDKVALELGVKDVHHPHPSSLFLFVVGLLCLRVYISPLQFADWYGITKSAVLERGGVAVLKLYASLGDALQAVYPEYAWQPSKFHKPKDKLPHGYWTDLNHQREFLAKLEKELNIQQV